MMTTSPPATNNIGPLVLAPAGSVATMFTGAAPEPGETVPTGAAGLPHGGG